MKNKNFYRREFLNKPGYHTVGNIMVEIEDMRDDMGYSPFFSSLYISNCDRTIRLILDTDSTEDVDNSMHKLSKIVGVCQEAIKNLVRIRPDVVEWEIKRDNKKEE